MLSPCRKSPRSATLPKRHIPVDTNLCDCHHNFGSTGLWPQVSVSPLVCGFDMSEKKTLKPLVQPKILPSYYFMPEVERLHPAWKEQKFRSIFYILPTGPSILTRFPDAAGCRGASSFTVRYYRRLIYSVLNTQSGQSDISIEHEQNKGNSVSCRERVGEKNTWELKFKSVLLNTCDSVKEEGEISLFHLLSENSWNKVARTANRLRSIF